MEALKMYERTVTVDLEGEWGIVVYYPTANLLKVGGYSFHPESSTPLLKQLAAVYSLSTATKNKVLDVLVARLVTGKRLAPMYQLIEDRLHCWEGYDINVKKVSERNMDRVVEEVSGFSNE